MNYLGLGLAAVPWLLAIGGWIYAARKADARETRKELRADAAEVATQVEQISSSLKDYISKGLDDTERAIFRTAILSELQLLLSNAERVIDDLRNGSDDITAAACSKHLSQFYELASNDYLESSVEGTRHDAALHYFELRAAGLMLKSSIDRLFRARFPARTK